jgi:thiamine-monophosphate kinase
MLDVSDGLAKDLGRLCAESRVGAAVELSRIPVEPALEEGRAAIGLDPLALALGGGEDYELLATLPAEAVPAAAGSLHERFGTALTDIGVIRAEAGLVAIGADGTEATLEPTGWDHFVA